MIPVAYTQTDSLGNAGVTCRLSNGVMEVLDLVMEVLVRVCDRI